MTSQYQVGPPQPHPSVGQRVSSGNGGIDEADLYCHEDMPPFRDPGVRPPAPSTSVGGLRGRLVDELQPSVDEQGGEEDQSSKPPRSFPVPVDQTEPSKPASKKKSNQTKPESSEKAAKRKGTESSKQRRGYIREAGYKRGPYKKRKSNEASPDRQTADPSSSSQNRLVFSWSPLNLGTVAGSAAWNRILQNQGLEEASWRNPRTAVIPQVDAIDVLRSIQTLQVPTVLPPDGSPLSRILQRPRFEVKKAVEEEIKRSTSSVEAPDSDGMAWWTRMGHLYHDMAAQDVDRGAFLQDQYQYMTPDAVRERLSDLEERAAALQQRQRDVEQRQADAFVHPLVPPQLKVPRDAYWSVNFSRMLAMRQDKVGFLTPHDRC